jgi:hypothetical protein
VLTVSLTPRHAGTDHGSLTTTVTDDLGAPVIFTVPITATVASEAALLAVNPDVAPAGQVTDVTGTGFIPGQDVTLSWDPGLGQVSLAADGTARLTAVMIVFPDDFATTTDRVQPRACRLRINRSAVSSSESTATIATQGGSAASMSVRTISCWARSAVSSPAREIGSLVCRYTGTFAFIFAPS